MKLTFQVNNNATIDAEVKDLKQAFQFLAYAESVFGIGECGSCQSRNLKFLHRTPKGFDYYSVQCQDCRYELKFGQQKEAPHHLYPKGWEAPYERGSRSSSSDDHAERYYDSPPARNGSRRETVPADDYDDEIAF